MGTATITVRSIGQLMGWIGLRRKPERDWLPVSVCRACDELETPAGCTLTLRYAIIAFPNRQWQDGGRALGTRGQAMRAYRKTAHSINCILDVKVLSQSNYLMVLNQSENNKRRRPVGEGIDPYSYIDTRIWTVICDRHPELVFRRHRQHRQALTFYFRARQAAVYCLAWG